jgi:hypothetical protein
MANVLSVVWFVIGSVATLTAVWVWTCLMLPAPVGRARRRLERQPLVCFFQGLLFCAAALLVLTALVYIRLRVLLAVGESLKDLSFLLGIRSRDYFAPVFVQSVGLMTVGPLLAGLTVGSAGVVQILAGRMRQQRPNGSPLFALCGGALATALSAFLPIIGWLVFTPVVGLMSVGAGVMGVFSRRRLEGDEAHTAASEVMPDLTPQQG